MIYLFSDLMMEWNNDEISKLIDFFEKNSDASTMLFAIFLVQGIVMNLHYQFLLRVSPALLLWVEEQCYCWLIHFYRLEVRSRTM